MRWKLLIAAPLLAALVGAGACLLAARLLETGPPGSAPVWPAAAMLLFPVGASAAASVFVYRHTARRRALQAMLTALLASLLALTALVAYAVLTRPALETQPYPAARAL